MKLSTTLFLVLLLSGLGAYYLAFEKPSFQSIESIPPKVLNLAEGDSLTYFEIHNFETGEKLVLRRKGSDWVLTSPVYYPAENFLVEGMIHALAFSRRERRFSLAGKNPGEFGLGRPRIQITLQTSKQPKRRTLAFGGDSPVTEGGHYARWQDEEEIFLIPAPLRSSFEKSVYSLRKKKLFRVSWDDIGFLALQSGQKKYRLEKKEGKWRWVSPPLGGEIPLEKVSDLIYSFQALYIKEFLDGRPPKDKEFGLHSPGNILEAGSGGGGGEKEKLVVGARAKGRDALYAIREKENLVLLISEKNLRSLVELFEVVRQEGPGDGSGEAQGSSGKNRKGGSASGKKAVGGDTRPRDQKRSSSVDQGGVSSGGEGFRREPAPGTPAKKS